MDAKKPFSIRKFDGGYCGNLSPAQLETNQAADLDNIVIKPNGLGWRTRRGDSKLNSSQLNSGTPIMGIGLLLQADQDKWLVTVTGTKFFTSSNISGTFTDSTGAYAGITSDANNRWNLFTFNDAVIGFGGPPSNPDAPIRWTGSGDVAALGGTAPSAYGAISANNRVFAFRTAANPSTLYWSIVGDATDFGGTGSGSVVIGSVSDNQRVTAAVAINTNYMLVFKENSTYMTVISAAPFSVFSLFPNVGCTGKGAAVNIDGEVYFISSQRRMISTNGERLQTYPNGADDLWDSVEAAFFPYITGYRQRGADYDWIVWGVSISGTRRAIVWDLLNKCWLRCSTGYKFNSVGFDDTGQVYLGGTGATAGGYIFKPDQSGVYADASESAPGTITGYWRSGWLNPSQVDEIVQVSKFTATYKTKASGSISVSYGFDFTPDSKSFTLSQTATASELHTSRSSMLTGRGNFFQFKVQQSSSTIDTELHSITLRGKVYGQKRISVS